MKLNFFKAAQIGPLTKSLEPLKFRLSLYMHQKPATIHLAVANMPLYEMLRPPVCSCSIPGECETSEDNVLEVGNVKNDKDDNLLV